MGHDTDNLSPLRLLRAHAKQDALADSRLVGKCLRRECLINYEQVPVRCAVVRSKGPAGQKSRAHRLEIAGQNDLKIGSLKLARICLSFGSAPPHRTKSTGEGQGK